MSCCWQTDKTLWMISDGVCLKRITLCYNWLTVWPVKQTVFTGHDRIFGVGEVPGCQLSSSCSFDWSSAEHCQRKHIRKYWILAFNCTWADQISSKHCSDWRSTVYKVNENSLGKTNKVLMVGVHVGQLNVYQEQHLKKYERELYI